MTIGTSALTSASDDRSVREGRLGASEAWLGALADAAPQIVWSAPPDGAPDYCNESWRAYAGEAAADGAHWIERVHPEEMDETLAGWRHSVATGEPFAIEHRIGGADGQWRWFLTRAWSSRDASGAVARWFGVASDIDDVVRHGVELERMVAERDQDLGVANLRVAVEEAGRREEQTALRDLGALAAAYIDNTSDGVFVVSVRPDGSIAAETINRVLERGLGVSRAEVQGKPIHVFMPGNTAPRLIEKIAECVELRDSLRYEQTAEIGDVERVFEVTLAPVVTALAQATRVVGSVRDLTERREAEQQLRQAQKMEAVGQLTGGVAHDFNNLLQVVKGNLDLLSHELAGVMTPAIERRLRDAMSGAERGAKLTRQLLAFSRRQPLAPKPTDVGALIASMSDLLERTLGETVEVGIERDAGGWTALVDPQQFENAVLNLAINARDAMPDGGRLAIAVRNVAGIEDSIEISVADRGSGMTPQVLGRVFEPFFSTKPEGRGTGLGLPQVQGFIEQSNGRIEIESAPDRGTTVRLSLPRSSAAPAEEKEAPPAGARGSGERILVLEDDDAVRRAVADLLLTLGYEAVSAGTTREAQAILDLDEPFDLLLSDVVMPGSPTPPDFARSAKLAQPTLKVLFMSGYAEDAIVHQGRIDPDVHLIEKPYAKEALSQKLRQVLDRKPPARRAGPLRVLLVEDEPLIAMGISDLLSSFGYQVVEARNGAAAKAAFARGEVIDIALTDLGLPDIDGEALAEWMRGERPRLPIVFSTGRDDFAAPALLAASGPVGVLTKPFDSQTLRRTIEAFIGG